MSFPGNPSNTSSLAQIGCPLDDSTGLAVSLFAYAEYNVYRDGKPGSSLAIIALMDSASSMALLIESPALSLSTTPADK